MKPHLGVFLVLVRCPRCSARNGVDVRKAGLRSRSRCGRCGEALPRRLPAPLAVGLGALGVVLLGLLWLGAGWLDDRRDDSREAKIEKLLSRGQAAQAVELLRVPRGASSQEAALARTVAAALAEPVLAADRDLSSGRASIEGALERGDLLVEAHEATLPELVEILDAPLRRLQARRTALALVASAERIASSARLDADALERAIQAAEVEALTAPPDVATEASRLIGRLRARAAITAAREAAARRPDEARAILRKAARSQPRRGAPAEASAREPSADLSSLPMLEQLTRLREAVSTKDAALLRDVVLLRPDPGLGPEAAEEVDRELRRACQALASVEAEAAARAFDPDERVDLLLSAMTCDEVLPPEFLGAARAALASALVDRARRGGDVVAALDAWRDLDRPERDRALASVACIAESREDWVTAVAAWSSIEGRQGLRYLGECAAEAGDPPPSVPSASLDYPAAPRAGSAGS